MSSQLEEWKPIRGYECIYEVSSLGRVRSASRMVQDKNGRRWFVHGRMLRPGTGSHGYFTVCLSRFGLYDYRTVHSLVAEAFVENPDPEKLVVVEHKNRIRTDCRSSNLRWATQSLNVLNTCQSPRGENAAIGVYEHSDGRIRKFTVRFKNKHRGSFVTLAEASDFRNNLYNETLKLTK